MKFTTIFALIPVTVVTIPAHFPLRHGAIYRHASGLLVRLQEVIYDGDDVYASVYHHGQIPFYAETSDLFIASQDEVNRYLGH